MSIRAKSGTPLGVLEAYEALESFATENGTAPLILTMHAAIPETLRADLLNLIKINFVTEAIGDLSVDADVLFSPVTETLTGGYFRIDTQVRRQCLELLSSGYRNEEIPRAMRVASLLQAHVEHTERSFVPGSDPSLSSFLQIQRWVAYAFIDPNGAAETFAKVMKEAIEPNSTKALLRLGGLAAAIAIPLPAHHELLVYAEGLDALATGDDDRARRILERLPGPVAAGETVLPHPAELLDRFYTTPAPRARGPESRETHGEAGPAASRHINLPPPPALLVGREQDIEKARWYLVPPATFDEANNVDNIADVDWVDRPTSGRTVVLVGPDGIGKFTLARALVHDPNVQERYSVGIVWFDEASASSPLPILGDFVAKPGPSEVDWALVQERLSESRILFVVQEAADRELAKLLILLCHKWFLLFGLDRPLRQHGHLCCACASRTARRRLTVGIECAT